ncbi:MAG: hypothetical protein AAF108_07470 [Planctomycetota bacterium]
MEELLAEGVGLLVAVVGGFGFGVVECVDEVGEFEAVGLADVFEGEGWVEEVVEEVGGWSGIRPSALGSRRSGRSRGLVVVLGDAVHTAILQIRRGFSA